MDVFYQWGKIIAESIGSIDLVLDYTQLLKEQKFDVF